MMPLEAYRRVDHFFIYIDLPGVDRNDVELTVERNVVSVRAQWQPAHQDGDEVIVDERPQGIFTRQFFLGDNLDTDKLSADYDRGVLMLTIPVVEASKPRRIQLGEQQQPADQGSTKQPVTTS